MNLSNPFFTKSPFRQLCDGCHEDEWLHKTKCQQGAVVIWDELHRSKPSRLTTRIDSAITAFSTNSSCVCLSWAPVSSFKHDSFCQWAKMPHGKLLFWCWPLFVYLTHTLTHRCEIKIYLPSLCYSPSICRSLHSDNILITLLTNLARHDQSDIETWNGEKSLHIKDNTNCI